MHPTGRWLIVVLLATGCSAGGSAATATSDPTPISRPVDVSSTAASSVTTPSSVTARPSVTTGTDDLGRTPMARPPTSSSQSRDVDEIEACRPLADLDDEDELRRWRIVNDGVMGGRSTAEATVSSDAVLSLAGEIVTDGGGFSSVRLALDQPLGEATGLLLRIRTDGRPYELTVSDAAPGRDRRVSHQAPIPTVGGDTWEEVLVSFADLEASLFGRPVDVAPFDPGAVVEVGIILADGVDGPFRFELDWLRTCP